jgi:hypothetical protein
MGWLEQYQEYTEDTESSAIFNIWVGISTIASALRKKTWLELGRLKVFPNLYIVLVAEPGVARKSQAISYATSIVNDIPAIVTSADSITVQALIQDLEDATCYDSIPGEGTIRHASLSVISKEFETFLGSSGGSSRMLVTLTDLFDSGENPWKYRTKTSGIATIPSVFLNILGATTPHSLASCLSELAVGGGLTSRILFVCSKTRSKKVAVPELTQRLKDLRVQLSKDLLRISLMAGVFTFTPAALTFWKDWYESYDDSKDKRAQPRVEFDGWYSRKPLMIQKVAIILSASEGSDRLLHTRHVVTALKLVEDLEPEMGIIFPPEKEALVKDIAVVTSTWQSELLFQHIEVNEKIAEKKLLHLVWRQIPEDMFDYHMDLLLKSNKCSREFKSPDGEEAIWYLVKPREV